VTYSARACPLVTSRADPLVTFYRKLSLRYENMY